MIEQKDRYVVVDRYTGRVLVGNRTGKFQHGWGKFKEGIWQYPNRRKPILFASKENARNHLDGLFENPHEKYVRKARPRELRA